MDGRTRIRLSHNVVGAVDQRLIGRFDGNAVVPIGLSGGLPVQSDLPTPISQRFNLPVAQHNRAVTHCYRQARWMR